FGPRPHGGFTPEGAQSDPGVRTEPPPWAACPVGPRPRATAAAAPPLDAPGVRDGSHGFRVGPNRGLSVTALCPNSEVLVLPTITAPATRSRPTTSASSDGTSSANSREPPVLTSPRVGSTSFTDTGTPQSGPIGSPFITAISASRAAARALSCATRQKAFRRGLSRSIRA